MAVNQVSGNAPSRIPITPLPPSESKPQQQAEAKPGLPQPIEADVRAKQLVKPGMSQGQQQSMDAIQLAQARVSERDNRAVENQLAEAIEYGQNRQESVRQQFEFTDRLESESGQRAFQKHTVDRMGETFAEDKQNTEAWRVAFEADRDDMLTKLASFKQDAADNEAVRSEFSRDAAITRGFRANFDQDAASQRDFRANFQGDAATERDHLANFRGDAANERGFQSLSSSDVQELDQFWNQYFITLENLYESNADIDKESFENMRGLAKTFVEDEANIKHLQSLAADQLPDYLASVFGNAGERTSVETADVSKVTTSQPTTPPPQSSTDRVSQPPQPQISKLAEDTAPSSDVPLRAPSTNNVSPSVSQVAASTRPESIGQVGNAGHVGNVNSSAPSNGNKISDSIKNLASDRVQAQQAVGQNRQFTSSSSTGEIRELEDVRSKSADEVAQSGLALPGLSDWVRSSKSKPAKSENEKRRQDPRQKPSEQTDAPGYTESDDSTEQDPDSGDADQYA